jgi:DNA (cytosine-5)-methyltransferase 1
MLTLGSLFDGSGGFPFAGVMNGFEPLWASEVEPYPIAVTRSRFPQMLHLGNVCDVSGATVKPVDVITFGSPCQDLSVAGKRAGLKHEDHGDDETTRSGLFMEAVRIITEMREATNGRYPTFAVWENVPGAMSSSGGDDFLAVLENLAKIADPEVSIPKPDKWCANGEIVGNGWSIAWRIIDARHFGVTVRDGDTGDVLVRGTPQRRRRIYLVADFRGARAGKILFECAGVQGDSEPCAETRKGTSADAEGSVGGAVCYGISAYESNAMKSSNPHSGIYEADTSRTLDLNGGNPACNQGGIAVLFENHSQDTRFKGPLDVSPMLPAQLGTGGNNTPFVVEQTYCLQGSMIGRADKNYIVRRLTPTECARLQGFPDTWGHPDIKTEFTDEEYTFWQTVRDTHAEINSKPQKTYTRGQMLNWYNKLHTDSAEYKMWGNGIALPCAHFVLNRIAKELNNHDNQNPTADA